MTAYSLNRCEKELLCARFIEKETPVQMPSCEFCKIFHNIFLRNNSGRLLLDVTGTVGPTNIELLSTVIS